MSLFSRLRLRSHIRLFLTFMLSFLFPLSILTIIFLSSYYDIYERESQQSSCREMDAVAATIDAQFQSIATYLSMLSQDNEIQKNLMSSGNICSENAIWLSGIQRKYNATMPRVLNAETIVLTIDNQVLVGQEYLDSSRDIQDYIRTLESLAPSPVRESLWFSDSYADNNDYLFVARGIRDTSNWHTIGYVLLRIQASDLVSMYLNSTTPYRSIFIMDSTGNIISSIDNLAVRESIIETHKLRLMRSNDALVINGFTAYVNPLCNQWLLVSATETDATTQTNLTTSVTLYVIALLVCVVLTLIIAYVTSKRFTQPISLLISGMQKAEHGDLHSRVSLNTHDEFEDLANNYNKMIAQIEELMRQIVYEQEQKRLSDIRMLQSQINPHFLYNTLGSIRYMAYANPPQDVDTVLLSLTKFLNYVLSDTAVYASLDRELEQMEHYITIQRFGFNVPLRYEVTVEGNLGHCQIVKMLLQPLMENAILHGLKLNPKDPLLSIQISSIARDTIKIEISDNGPGFDTTVLSDKQESASLPHHHLGLANVRQRLKLHYGESYQFDITSRKGEGTSVTLCIPIQTSEDIHIEDFDC